MMMSLKVSTNSTSTALHGFFSVLALASKQGACGSRRWNPDRGPDDPADAGNSRSRTAGMVEEQLVGPHVSQEVARRIIAHSIPTRLAEAL